MAWVHHLHGLSSALIGHGLAVLPQRSLAGAPARRGCGSADAQGKGRSPKPPALFWSVRRGRAVNAWMGGLSAHVDRVEAITETGCGGMAGLTAERAGQLRGQGCVGRGPPGGTTVPARPATRPVATEAGRFSQSAGAASLQWVRFQFRADLVQQAEMTGAVVFTEHAWIPAHDLPSGYRQPTPQPARIRDKL
jgi:hypothetical protein